MRKKSVGEMKREGAEKLMRRRERKKRRIERTRRNKLSMTEKLLKVKN